MNSNSKLTPIEWSQVSGAEILNEDLGIPVKKGIEIKLKKEETKLELKEEKKKPLAGTVAKRGRLTEEEEAPKDLQGAREKAWEDLLAQVGKKFGSGAITVAKDAKYRDAPRLSTGLLAMDIALGGGWPKGRVSLLTGEYSTCKSRLLYAAIADAQKRSVVTNKYITPNTRKEEAVPHRCLYVDVEGAHTNEWAEALGVDITQLALARPQTQEEAAEIVVAALSSGAFDLIGIDSIDAMVPEDDVEAAMDEASYGTAAAKTNNKMFRKLQSILNGYSIEGEHLPTLIFINQIKTKIGVRLGKKTTYSGGSGQQFYSSVIVELRQGAIEYADTQRERPIAQTFHCYVEKNKVSPAKINAEYVMALTDEKDQKKGDFLEKGFVYDMALQYGFIEEKGSGAGKTWTAFGTEYKRKKDLTAAWFEDEANFRDLKSKILARALAR